jgi:hypothetical protein
MATTTYDFDLLSPFVPQREGFWTKGFLVQVIGFDLAGNGIYHSTFEAAREYAADCNSQGLRCVIRPA